MRKTGKQSMKYLVILLFLVLVLPLGVIAEEKSITEPLKARLYKGTGLDCPGCGTGVFSYELRIVQVGKRIFGRIHIDVGEPPGLDARLRNGRVRGGTISFTALATSAGRQREFNFHLRKKDNDDGLFGGVVDFASGISQADLTRVDLDLVSETKVEIDSLVE